MIQITITTQDHRGRFTGRRTNTFTIECPEVQSYLEMLHAQGWTEAHEAIVDFHKPVEAMDPDLTAGGN